MKEYKPKPVDTQSIQLPEELNSLVEEMSKNVHEVWAQTRIAQGWTYGEERNDASFQPMLNSHPSVRISALLPFGALLP